MNQPRPYHYCHYIHVCEISQITRHIHSTVFWHCTIVTRNYRSLIYYSQKLICTFIIISFSWFVSMWVTTTFEIWFQTRVFCIHYGWKIDFVLYPQLFRHFSMNQIEGADVSTTCFDRRLCHLLKIIHFHFTHYLFVYGFVNNESDKKISKEQRHGYQVSDYNTHSVLKLHFFLYFTNVIRFC